MSSVRALLSRRLTAPLVTALGAAALVAGLHAIDATADDPTVLACTQAAVQTALTNGGSYTFGCDGSIALSSTLTSGRETTLDATGHSIDLYVNSTLGDRSTFRRLMEVTGGSLVLRGLQLQGGGAVGAVGAPGAGGTPGTPGQLGSAGNGSTPAGNGTGGTAGQSGGPASAGTASRGGALLIDPGAGVKLDGVKVYGNKVYGGAGGTGGGGGAGGNGGGGGTCTNCHGGDGAAGAAGAAGGDGATGGAGQGGAAYVSQGASLTVVGGTDFETNQAYSGAGGVGGAGGHGGAGGSGGYGYSYGDGAGSTGADGGTGGRGGNAGAAQGGAIYNAGTLTVANATFIDDQVEVDGIAGTGGAGGGGGSGTNTTAGGRAGDGGGSSTVSGGAIYNAGSMSMVGATFSNSKATGNLGGPGGIGGDAGTSSASATTTYGTGGTGGNGGTGASVSFASIASDSPLTGVCADISGSKLTPGGAPSGGYGGYDGPNYHRAASGAAGTAGTAGTLDPSGLTPTASCGKPALSVADATVVEPSRKDATLSFPVTLSTASQSPVTVSYATSDGTATAGQDYDAAAGTLTIPAGGTSTTIPVKVHDVGYRGTTALTVTLSGANGADVARGQATGTIRGRGAIAVSVRWLTTDGQPLKLVEGDQTLPDTVRLADTDAGEVPRDVKAEVTLTNKGDVTQTNISLNGIPPLSYHDAADARQALPATVSGGPTPADPIGDLAAGASTQRTYAIHVTNNGLFDFSPQVLSSAQGSDGTQVGNGVGTLQALPTAMLWLALKPAATGAVPAGSDVPVVGTVTNRNLRQTLDVDPLEPSDDGNLGGGALIPVGQAPQPDGVQLPLNGEVAPGESKTVTSVLATGYVPATRGTATYKPSGAVLDAQGKGTALTATQVGMAAGSSPIDVAIDASDPQPPAADADSLIDSITDATVKVSGQWAVAHLQAGLDLLRHPIVGGSSAVKGVADFVVTTAGDVKTAASLVGAMYTLSVGYESLTPEERGAFAQQIEDDYTASHLGGSVTALKASADQVLPVFFNALSTHDYNKVAAMASGGLATGATGVADLVLSDIAFQKLALGLKTGGSKAITGALGENGAIARAIVLKDAIREAGVTAVKGKGLDRAQAGANLLARKAEVLKEDFGLTSRQISELITYCKRQKLVIAVRSRGRRAAELIKKGLAVGKNEAIKLKAVNQYDIDYLGYSKHDLNTVVWAEPVSEEHFAQVTRHLDDETKAIVTERYEIRRKEWKDPDIRKTIEHSDAKGHIDWNFDGESNGAKEANRKELRRFELRKQPNPVKDGGAHRTYQQVLVGREPGLNLHIRVVPVTQDVDLMAVLRADGGILSSVERAAAYIHLSDILDIQHGETPTWIKDGEILFQKKAKQLVDVVSGGEPLAVFNPKGGVTAGFFDSALTIFDNKTLGGRIFFDGGYNDPFSKLKTQLQLYLKGKKVL